MHSTGVMRRSSVFGARWRRFGRSVPWTDVSDAQVQLAITKCPLVAASACVKHDVMCDAPPRRGCAMGVQWVRGGYTVGTPWVHRGFTVGSPWVHRGYTVPCQGMQPKLHSPPLRNRAGKRARHRQIRNVLGPSKFYFT
ncbi:hypothetical protein M433DRAFT_292836 [Acidomyces richmondensis BFW]|nr:MAG: hypothetical protein FE78DRAFT_444896 [Acidomyces sp. 'richmondensis']KYG44666.1 hypothetical protein M433DRAFT_292836 [Acidomyces richmondensis BFW]